MKGKLQKQKVTKIGDKTGSDHLYDNQKETVRGSKVMKSASRTRVPRRPTN